MKAKVNGIEIYYELHGKEGAPWLVLSHSLACSLRMWDPQIEAFKGAIASSPTTCAATGRRAPRQGPIRSTCWPTMFSVSPLPSRSRARSTAGCRSAA